MSRYSTYRKPLQAVAALGNAAPEAGAGDVRIVKNEPGKPHRGKVFAA